MKYKGDMNEISPRVGGWAQTDRLLLQEFQTKLEYSLAKGEGASTYHLTNMLRDIVKIVIVLNENRIHGRKI